MFLIYDFVSYKISLNNPANPNSKTKIMFIIKSGDSLKIISENLEEKGLVSSSRYFYKYVKATDNDTRVLAGGFLLSPSMTIPEITEDITDNSKNQYVVTVPEGFSVKDIDEKLVEMGLIKSGDFVSSVRNFANYDKYDFLNKPRLAGLKIPLEGYLFPDTYYIKPQNFKSEELIERMLANFSAKLLPNLRKEISRKGRTIHEIVTMASMLEKEGKTKDDFEIMAGILWKRLSYNWFLDVDAAILYETNKKTISSADLQLNSAYNLRRHHGLPPSPISNPGINAISAAISPKTSPYWFYLTTHSGQTIYAKTNDEQNLNIAKYLK
ncbi:endolytic transglycosylase MltG [Candidatus Peregrinibacteria bacterium]|nr:endolytic transglycosylase MltG [Candidatus Peregrinibacteria bacterium]